MRDQTEMFSRSGEHVAMISFNEAYGLWQIIVVQREAIEFFCPTKALAFAAWREEFDSETGFPRATATGMPEACTLSGRRSKSPLNP
jgi:hypothetical protein